MNVRRLRPADWLSGAAGVALLVLLWAPWYDASGEGVSGWSAFSVIDLWLALSAALAIGVAVLTLVRDSPAIPVTFAVLTFSAGTVAVLLVVIRLLWVPHGDLGTGRDWGLYAGLAAAIAVTWGGFWSMRDETGPGLRPTPPVQTMPAPPATAEPS